MRARTALWEPWGGNAPGPPGPTHVNALCKSQSGCADAPKGSLRSGAGPPSGGGASECVSFGGPIFSRVERWRGGVGFGIVPCRGFPVCASIAACHAPFPPPAHRTGRADFPHRALRLASPAWTYGRKRLGEVLHRQWNVIWHVAADPRPNPSFPCSGIPYWRGSMGLLY